ncbi:carboxypeptidase-like regulatory domain-containing protein [Mucilaginibacter sp. JRF]|uniref:carboxypeptidase-like regulatory domain-containing protein n=1 Tax=Mucilaginibacter sp. JRF TaxID=2780088 RepID=UPI00187FF965|nr:carboxypeptidase-like regulatory domain-containing protein [Mucilaginibacter sp. JRF]MBE9584457.1 carboxypeptidase-like regulatory domain-containing protein [Mucilaginibacter sp. JRF]
MFFIVLTFGCTLSSAAQSTHLLTGKLTDSLSRPIPSATVFIVGMTKMTSTGKDGTFRFDGLQAGTYQLSVSMMGFAKHTETVILTEPVIDLKITLHPTDILLTEVIISSGGNKKDREENYKMFQKVFLGGSVNAKKCRILNPETLHLKFDKKADMLTAYADDLIIVENEALGYKVRYLLNNFSYHATQDHASFSGNSTFEELPGNDKQKGIWADARAKAYQGSLMQFFRGLYNSNAREEGFLIHQAYERVPVVGGGDDREYVNIDPNEIDLYTISKLGLDSLMRLQFTKLFITYAPKQAAKQRLLYVDARKKQVPITTNCTLMYLLTDGAMIDQKGDASGQHNFTIQGNMALRRVADQLPFEYYPAKPGQPTAKL